MSSGGITLDEVLAACERVGKVCDPVTASEVGEELGCTRRAALNKLDELAERGDIESKTVGARSRVWWRPPDRSSAYEQADTDDAPAPSSVTVDESLDEIDKRLEAELDKVFGRISEGFYALDNQWKFTYVSERAKELIDAQDMDLVEESFWEVFDDEADTAFSENYRTAMETQEPTFFEVYDETLDAWYEVHAYPSESGLSVYLRDVTNLVERERELEQSERRYRALVEHFPNGAVALVDEDLHYRTVGGNPLDVADVTVEAIENRPVREALPPKLADELVPRYEAAMEGESNSFEAEYDDRTFEFHIVPVRDDDGNVFAALGMSQDVTKRKESERELERALDLLERTERIADVGGWEIDVDTQDVFWTDHIFELLEVDADEEPPLDEALNMYHEEDQPIVEAAVEDALASGDSFDIEVRIHTDHSGIRWLRLQGVPETVDGDVVSFRGAAQDITEQKERERELQERNDRLDSFASMLAHELRNPVTIGQIYSQQLPDETESDAVEYVTEAFDRIEDMIDVLLVLTQGREAIGERTPIHLADAAREAWDKVEAPEATLNIEFDYTTQADKTYVQHLFRNLFENAVEHGGSDVTITVGGLPTGFFVADDGHGIPAGERDGVFEAGYTTAADQGGTGLGLAYVKELAEVYEWEYTVTESSTGGARVEFTNVDQAAPSN
ncbi:PAS domain-containing protein [Halorussus sp. GCM10023401]